MKRHLLLATMMMALVSLYGCTKEEKKDEPATQDVSKEEGEATLFGGFKDVKKPEPQDVLKDEGEATLFGFSDIKKGYQGAKEFGNKAAGVLDKATSAAEKVVVDAAKGTVVESTWNKASGAMKNIQSKVEARIEQSASDTAKNMGEGMGSGARFLVPEKYKADVYEGAQVGALKKAEQMGQKMEEAKAESAARAEARQQKALPPTPTP